MPDARQLRVLYHEFLFRLMDVELLAASARGDSTSLLGQFGSLLVFASVLSSWAAISVGNALRRGGTAPPVWSAERFLISLTMLAVGLFVVLSWESTFPDRRDVLVLGPLPVRARTLFAAKIAATASSLAVIVGALNCLSGFAWPLVLAPDGSGLFGALRFIAAFWIALLYGAVLGVQAVAALLPRNAYLRLSPILQMAAFILFLGVFCLAPSYSTAAALAAPENQRALAWLPPYWFMGLLSELGGAFPREGHAVMAPLAHRAVAALAAAIAIAGGAFLLSYLRTLRQIVEAADLVPGARGGLWLPRAGTLPETALAHFAVRTLLRSRQHRVILAFYLGGGFAIVALYIAIVRDVQHLTGIDMVHRVNAPMLVASVLLLCAAWLGARTLFSLPLDLRANWVFQIAPSPGSASCLAASRRALLGLTALPVGTLTAAVLFSLWPWKPVAGHLAVFALLASILVDLSLAGFRKIPFTCSYLPGKSKVPMVFWFGIVPLVMAIHRIVELELRALQSPLGFAAMIAGLAAAAIAARKLSIRPSPYGDADTQFEESGPGELLALGLNR